ncbi:MAG: polysaccharide deacetylase family protein [Terriglobales bacterium]
MIVLSSILRRAVYPAMSKTDMFSRRLRPGDVCALTYHGVLPPGAKFGQSPTDGTLVSAENFRRQLRFLKSRYQLITPEEFRNWCDGRGSLPARAVLLTCDDGLLNVLTEMVPILLEEGARCLFFVAGAAVDDDSTDDDSTHDGPAYLWYEELYQMLAQAPAEHAAAALGNRAGKSSGGKLNVLGYWEDEIRELSKLNAEDRRAALSSLRSRLSLPDDWRMHDSGDGPAERRFRLLNRAELRQLVAQGMTVGAHTASHPWLPSMEAELARREIQECRSRLESCLQREIWAMAYPFGSEGSAGEREMKMAQDAGFTCAFLNHGGGRFRQTSPRFALPRAHVSYAMEIPELEAHLSGFHERLQKRFRGRGPNREKANPSCA